MVAKAYVHAHAGGVAQHAHTHTQHTPIHSNKCVFKRTHLGVAVGVRGHAVVHAVEQVAVRRPVRLVLWCVGVVVGSMRREGSMPLHAFEPTEETDRSIDRISLHPIPYSSISSPIHHTRNPDPILS